MTAIHLNPSWRNFNVNFKTTCSSPHFKNSKQNLKSPHLSLASIKHIVSSCFPLAPFRLCFQKTTDLSMAVLTRIPKTLTRTTTSSIKPLSSYISRSFSSTTLNSETDLKVPSFLSRNSPPLRQEPKDRNVQWVFLGCPGVGKGTYASRLSSLLGIPHIATGDLVREELNSSGTLSSQLKEIVNQGKLVSDEIIISLLSKRLEAGEAKGESGFILDGFPRTIRQAEILEGVTDVDLVVNLKLREEALLAKCLGRRICSHCGGNYNIACIDIKGENGKPGIYMAPLPAPPQCVPNLIQRADDTEEVVKERLRIYNETSRPVEEFYRNRRKLLEFELPGGIPEAWPKLLEALNLDHKDKHIAAA